MQQGLSIAGRLDKNSTGPENTIHKWQIAVKHFLDFRQINVTVYCTFQQHLSAADLMSVNVRTSLHNPSCRPQWLAKVTKQETIYNSQGENNLPMLLCRNFSQVAAISHKITPKWYWHPGGNKQVVLSLTTPGQDAFPNIYFSIVLSIYIVFTCKSLWSLTLYSYTRRTLWWRLFWVSTKPVFPIYQCPLPET